MNVNARVQKTILLLFLCLLAPLASDAANQAACCNVNLPPPSPPGDEDFFSIPGGIPNVMILLDNSGSMLELVNSIAAPSTVSSNGGTCSNHDLNNYTSLRTTKLPDKGQTSSTITDAPPWGTGCTGDNCLFDPTAYYKLQDWTSSTAKRYPSGVAKATGTTYPASRDGICRATQKTGTLSSADIARNTAAAQECAVCLQDKGFYLFYPPGSTTLSSVFQGDFLNGYPPKYVAARRVVKGIAFMDPTTPSPLDTVRLGLTVFTTPGDDSGTSSALRSNDGGVLTVPLGPSCSGAFPYDPLAYKTARQTLIDAINDTSKVTFGSNTPLAETLFNIGQYFSNTGSSALYQTLFGASWVRTSFAETAAGSIGASWASGSNNRSFCWACQQSSVVVVTDGEPNKDSNLPKYPTPSTHSTFNNDFRGWRNSTLSCGGGGGGVCDNCGCDGSDNNLGNTLHKVAYFLNQTDMRPDLSGAQKVSIYTISFGLTAASDPKALAELQKTADLGGGQFKNTSSAEELASALSSAVTDVVSKSTSFSASAASSLQTSKTAQTGSYLARFRPLDGPAWEGHLFSAMIFDEFGMGCIPNKANTSQTVIPTSVSSACAGRNPNLNGNVDANNYSDCTDVFLVDQDCDPIIEDALGTFHKGVFDSSSKQVVSSPDPANLAWDAGELLSNPTKAGYKSADASASNARKIWTVIDTSGDGKFTATDGLTEFKSDNAATLAPFLALDPTWCLSMMQSIGLCGLSPLPTCPTVTGWTAANTTTCATQVINYVRGYDVTDQDGDHCAGPGNPSNAIDWGSCATSADCKGNSESPAKNSCVSGKCRPNCASGEQRDRTNDARTSDPQFWKLGDIFHSAPAVISPPYTKALASTGWENQALMTLFASWGSSAPGTPLNPSSAPDAYDTFVSGNASRPPLILVGANDGMLHAFCAANPGGSCTPGTELWGFIPPDILPRLRDSLFKHQYYVDGNIMIRDIWVDENKNGTKEKTEYHTMAVITERSGGHSFTGLDITSTGADRPVYRWTFPQLCTPESRIMGETWSDFPPRPPPIGPVKIALPYSGSPADPLSRKWEERWVVGLNGGFDSTLVRGRAAFINDVWTGDVLWSLTDADLRTGGKNDLGYGDKVSLFPVPANLGLIDAGNASTAYGDSDGIFDTATFGDMGGNLWLVRMAEPGVLDSSTKRVTNWFAARAFEEQRRTDNAQYISGRSPFFFMTGNTFDTEMGYLRTYAGTGNRERLLDQKQTCSADNVLGCCQAGCTVISSSTPTSGAVDNFGSCSVAQSFSCSAGLLTSTPAAGSGTCPSSGYSCSQNKVTVTLNMDCGAGALPPIVASLNCDSAGLCSQVQPFGTSTIYTPPSASSSATLPKSHMYGVWSYGGTSTSRAFSSLAGAKVFDAHRSTDVTYSAAACAPANGCRLVNTEGASYSRTTGVSCTPTGSTCQASTLDPGWMYEYGVKCPLQSCSPPPPWTDEKTATGASPAWGCTLFSTTRPTGGNSGNDPCTSSVGSPIAYGYALDYLTGTPSSVCGFFSGNNGAAAYSRNSSAPPQNPMPRIIVTADGQVKMTTLQMDAGSQPDSNDMGYRDSLVNVLYYLEVPRDLHTCRHADPKTCK